MFRINDIDEKLLDSCKEKRNDLKWFGYCRNICEKFHFLFLDEFFFPNQKKFVEFNFFLENVLNKYDL